MAIFSGFSTVESQRNYKLYDIDLVKRDLLNHFHTRKGERVMRPTFGSIIWDFLMEPLTEYVVSEIKKDALQICESDPRVRVLGIDVSSKDHSILVDIHLEYIPFDIADRLLVVFNERENTTGAF